MNYLGVDERSVKIWRIISLIVNGAVIGLCLGFLLMHIFVVQQSTFVFVVCVALLFVAIISLLTEHFILILLRFRTFRYCVTSDFVAIRRGYFIRRQTYIPLKTINHVALRETPIARRYKVARLEIRTLSDTHFIEFLDIESAEKLREQIVDLLPLR